MTYSAGSPIQATDYNDFATLNASVNQVYADNYPGATTLPDAGYGYGQSPALTSVLVGDPVQATEWANLFSAMRKCGAHQGTTVVPPLPAGNPVIGDTVVAYPPVGAISSLVTLLNTNRFNLASGQTTLLAGTSYSQTAPTIPWTNTLTFNYQVNFGSWNNARYFFNSGGKLLLNGSMAPVNPITPTPEEIQWISMLTTMSPLVFNHVATTPNTGTGGTAIGFYGLTTAYQDIYNKVYGSGGGYYYATNSVIVRAKLATTAGTNGIIDFSVTLFDGDPVPTAKYSTTTYRIDTVTASGSNVAYPGTVIVATVGTNNGFVST